MRVRVIHINIDVELIEGIKAAEGTPLDEHSDEFEVMMKAARSALDDRDYFPVLGEKLMEAKYKSNYRGSKSLQYIYFKFDDDLKVKLVLDVRVSDHRLPAAKSHSGKVKMSGDDNKKRWLKEKGQYEFVNEEGFDFSEEVLDPEFINIWMGYNNITGHPLSIFIDDHECFTFEEATQVLLKRINKLP